jgi:hypothetical protein
MDKFYKWLERQPEPLQNLILAPMVIGAYIIGLCQGSWEAFMIGYKEGRKKIENRK